LDKFDITRPITKPYYDLRNWGISQTGNLFLINLFIAILASLIWSFGDRHRTNYEKLDQCLRFYIRIYLAYFMFVYGFAKVFLVQPAAITESRLTLPYGMQRPSQVFWHFLGYSDAFAQFIGWAEVVGGLLLLWRRTVTIGALLLAGVLSVVVMVNFCFSINVRLFSLNLLLIAIFLLWKDRGRLVNLFFLNKPTVKVAHVQLINHPLWRKIFMTLQLLLVTCLLYIAIRDNRIYTAARNTPRPLDGIYHTEYFIRGADTIPPLQTDSMRWKKLIIDSHARHFHFSYVQLSTDSLKYCNTIVDTIDKVIRFQFKAQDGRGTLLDSCRMGYSLPDTSHLFLQGLWKNDSIQVMMKKYDLNNYRLRGTKFNWVID